MQYINKWAWLHSNKTLFRKKKKLAEGCIYWLLSKPQCCAVFYLVTQSCLTLWDPVDCSLSGSSVHRDSPGKNTGVGCHALLQRIFPTQWLNPGLLHCRQILYQLSQQGSPKILEWVAYSFSRGFSPPRSQTGVSCTAGRFLTSWATREAPKPQWWHGNEKKEIIWGVEKKYHILKSAWIRVGRRGRSQRFQTMHQSLK